MHCSAPMLSVAIMIFEGGMAVSLRISLWINFTAASSAFISVSYDSIYSPSGPFSEVISIPFLYATTPYPVLWVPLSYDREPSVYMYMYSLFSLYSSYTLEWSSAHSNFTDVPSLFSGTYMRMRLCKSWSYSDLCQGGSAWGNMHSVLGVMAFAIWMSLISVVFLAFVSCCLMR